LSCRRLGTPGIGFEYSPESAGKESPPAEQRDENPGQARRPFSQELRRGWLDAKGVVPTENQIALAALCWAVKEQMRDESFTPWLADNPIQVDWPLDDSFGRFAALDLFGILPEGVTDDHLRSAWLDLYGLPLTDKEKEKAAVKWVTLRQKQKV
jgi:hypothetical protein